MYGLPYVWNNKLLHELPNNLGPKTLGNEELLSLFTVVFIDLMICGYERVTRGFELVTRGFELAYLKFNSCFWAFN